MLVQFSRKQGVTQLKPIYVYKRVHHLATPQPIRPLLLPAWMMIAYPVANEPAFSNNTAGWVSTDTLLPLLTSLTATVLALCACKQHIVYNQSTRTILSVRSWIHGQTRAEFKSSHNVCVHVCAYSACMRAHLCSVYWTACLVGLGRVLDVWPGVVLGLTS